MEKVLVDSTIIAKYLRTAAGILADIMGSYKLIISAVTMTELLAGERASNQAANRQLRDFISQNFELIPVNAEIAGLAADLVRAHKISLASAYVAATALHEGIPLLTEEMNVYDRIPDLKLVDI